MNPTLAPPPTKYLTGTRAVNDDGTRISTTLLPQDLPR